MGLAIISLCEQYGLEYLFLTGGTDLAPIQDALAKSDIEASGRPKLCSAQRPSRSGLYWNGNGVRNVHGGKNHQANQRKLYWGRIFKCSKYFLKDQDNESRFLVLSCIDCGEKYPLETHSRCIKCNGILSGRYDLDRPINLERRGDSMWQHRDYLPPVGEADIVSMGEGWTPLVKSNRLAKAIGLDAENLLCKMEGQNPSGSFKDRAASLSVSLLRMWKKKGVFLASSGNAAAATAAYSARAGIPCLVLFRDDSTAAKLGQIAMYDPIIVRVKGLYSSFDSLKKAFEFTQQSLPDWLNGFVSAKYNPLLLDALKTIAYEIATQASGDDMLPDYVFVPTAGGDLLYGIYKGFAELKSLGQIGKLPRIVVVQGAGACPTVGAVEGNGNNEDGSTHARVETIAGALRSSTVSEHGVAAVKESRGFGVAVSNEGIIEAQRLAAKLEGVFCEISSAAALAAVAKAIRDGRMHKDERACVIVTGNGFKDYHSPFTEVSEVPFVESPELIPSVIAKIVPVSHAKV